MYIFWMLCLFNVLWVTRTSVVKTVGTSGPMCGKKHRCITEAECNENKVLCECKEPLVGNGKLGCVDPLDATVFLQSDPHMKNFFGEFLTVATPCRYLVTEYTLTNADGYVADVEILAENILQNGGIYYVDKILIEVSVMFLGDMRKDTIMVQGTAQGGEYDFSFTPLENIAIDTAVDVNDNFTDFKISATVDEVNNFAVMKVRAAGLTIRFRPAAVDEADQTLVPGVTIEIDKDALPDITFRNSLIASSPAGPSVQQMASIRSVTEEEYTQFLMLKTTPRTTMEDRICQDIRSLYNGNICLSDGMRLLVLRSCNSIFADEEFLTCLFEKNDVNEFYEIQKLYFRFCIQAFCSFNEGLCQNLKTQLPEKTSCPLPASLQNATCTF